MREIERGVCQNCGLDGAKLVSALRAVRTDGDDGGEAMRERWRILGAHSPSFVSRGFRALGERLVRQPIEGNAWEADHIVPVFLGGGCCGLENVRTLCVCCHKLVTKKQAAHRVEQRRTAHPLPYTPSVPKPKATRSKGPRGRRRTIKPKYLSDSSEDDEDARKADVRAAREAPRQRKKRRSEYLSDDSDDDST